MNARAQVASRDLEAGMRLPDLYGRSTAIVRVWLGSSGTRIIVALDGGGECSYPIVHCSVEVVMP